MHPFYNKVWRCLKGWGKDEGRCFRKVSNKAVVKSRTEMEQMLEAKNKTNKENKKLDINKTWKWKVSVWID